MPPDPVLVAVGGAAEALVVRAAERSAGRVVVTRRCADRGELLAAAGAGLGRVAVCASDLVGLDRDAVQALHATGVRVLLLVDPGGRHGRRVLGLGADAVADLPLQDDQAEQVLATVARLAASGSVETPPVPAPRADPAARAGAVVAVWGPTGAPGRTTLAVNLAAELAGEHGTALLVDADTYGGVVAQVLGVLDESPGLAAAARAAGQGLLDLPTLARLAPVLAPDLRLLSGITRADRWPELPAAALDQVWAVARTLARWVVVDTGFSLEQDEALSYDTRAPQRNAATLSALAAADVVVVVGTGDPVGVQRLVRALSELSDLSGPQGSAPRLVVVNRVRSSVAGPRPAAAVRDALARYAGVRAALVVPDDRDAVDEALRTGRALREVAAGSAARKAVVELAHRVVAQVGPVP